MIVGCGRVGRHIADVLGKMHVPRLVVESDAGLLDRLRELAIPVLYGDAPTPRFSARRTSNARS